MSQTLSGVMDTLRRLFMGKVKIHALQCDERPLPAVFDARRSVEVFRSEAFERVPKVHAPRLRLAEVKGEIACGDVQGRVRKVDFSVPRVLRVSVAELVRSASSVRGGKVRSLTVRHGSLHITRPRTTVHKGNEILAKLPQRRKNLLSALRARPRFEGGAVLALFAPVLQEGVIKSVLDKGSGDLLVWMDPWSRSRKAFRVFLVRRLSGTPLLNWVWLPVEGESRIVGGGPPKG